MALTMHTHSGQFCPGHAKDSLRAIVARAEALGLTTVALTEHMPRLSEGDLYPEEIEAEEAEEADDGGTPKEQPSGSSSTRNPGAAAATAAKAALARLEPRHEAYLVEAAKVRKEYEEKASAAAAAETEKEKEMVRPMQILIGFEGEFIRPNDYAPYLRRLASDPRVDFWIGSLHHVRGVPIDFDAAMYARAIQTVRKGGWGYAWEGAEPPMETDGVHHVEQSNDDVNAGERALFAAYYDEQHVLLRDMRPPVIGHFDLVRLLSATPNADARTAWGTEVWDKVLRNLRTAAEYGAWLECNSSALRKGLKEPYPARAIAEVRLLGLGPVWEAARD